MERVANFLHKIAGITPKSHKITQGTVPGHSKNSPGPRNEVPDRFGEGRTCLIVFEKCIFWSMIFHRWQHTDV